MDFGTEIAELATSFVSDLLNLIFEFLEALFGGLAGGFGALL